MSEAIQRIGFIGFGEVGGIFGEDLVAAGRHVSAYDPLFHDATSRQWLLEKAERAGVRPAESLRDLLADSQLLFSATTAASAVGVAAAAAPLLENGQIFLDLNSVSPDTKREMSAEIARSSAYFIEGAVMAAVKAARLKTPILLGGARAAEVASELRILGMETTAASENIGVVSAVKMCRSVLMKGMAALAIESLFAARRYGAEEAVLASFEATYPSMGWKDKLADALVMRAVEHSRRRAAEMRESAETVEGAGLVSRMALATAELQDWLTDEMDAGRYTFRAGEPFRWTEVADAMARRPSTATSK
jgi:3-hydroxyisobutyrate dehydrogenase-like beta-hydroxyacid dehydrogenase